MDAYIYYFITLMAGFYAGWYLREYAASRSVNKIMAELHEKEKVTDANRILATVEITDDGIFIYDKDNGSYLTHGPTFNSIEDSLRAKFPGKTFAISQDDLQKFMK